MDEIKNVKFWIFDLDNTLYPSSTNLFSRIDKLMANFITEHLNVNHEEAIQIKNDYFQKHGTTLNGLIKNHNVDPHHFLEFVHNIDYSFLNKNEKLNKEIKSLPGKKLFLLMDQENMQKMLLIIYNLMKTYFQYLTLLIQILFQNQKGLLMRGLLKSTILCLSKVFFLKILQETSSPLMILA